MKKSESAMCGIGDQWAKDTQPQEIMDTNSSTKFDGKALLEATPEYFKTYTKQVPEGDITELLAQQTTEFLTFLGSIPTEKGDFAYDEGKWSIKEVLGHINDTERIFAYRTLRISRGDKTPLPGYEQDDYIPFGNFGLRSMKSLISEWNAIRQGTLSLAESLTETQLQQTGTASDTEMNPYSILYIIAGHTIHHWKVMKERYGV